MFSTITPDYYAFKREVKAHLDVDVPDIDEHIDVKFRKFGQRFLRLCVDQHTHLMGLVPFTIWYDTWRKI